MEKEWKEKDIRDANEERTYIKETVIGYVSCLIYNVDLWHGSIILHGCLDGVVKELNGKVMDRGVSMRKLNGVLM